MTGERKRTCNNVAEHFPVGLLCWAEFGHDGPHRSRRGDYEWHNPPIYVVRRRWFRREHWYRLGVPHPYSDGAAWLWNYEDPRGKRHSAIKEIERAATE